MRAVIYLILLLIGPQVFAEAPPNLSISDASRPLVVGSESSEFSITLPSTPSTGYVWHMINFNPSMVTPVSQVFKPNAAQAKTGEGLQTFTFAINKNLYRIPIATQVTFILVRSWNFDIAKKLTFNIATCAGINSFSPK